MPMRVALISKAGRSGGGASQVAEDLHAAFQQQCSLDVHSQRFVGQPFEGGQGQSERSLYRQGRRASLALKAERWLARRGLADAIPLRWFAADQALRQQHLLHFHDLSTVAAPLDLIVYSLRRPVLWTLHDCSPLTAGCLYPLGCSTYLRGCGSCPQLGHWPLPLAADRTALASRWRRRALADPRLTLVAPSRWLANEVAKLVPHRAVQVIPNGVCERTFAPLPPTCPEGARPLRLLFVANYVQEPRKGGLYLPDLVRWFNHQNVTVELTVIGQSPTGEQIQRFDRCSLIYRQRLADPVQLAEAYANADALLMLSHADNCPLVVLEAMACGLPVFAWETGGIPELLDANSGRVFAQGDEAQLLQVLLAARADGTLAAMRQGARSRVLQHYTRDRMAAAYSELYSRLLPTRPALHR